MKYKLSIKAISDYTQMSIMAGELYIIDENKIKSHVCRMVLENYFFIENETKIVIPTLINKFSDGVNNYKMQIAIANIKTKKINFYDKYFANNGEKITYENEIITVHNENNEFVTTDFLDISKTKIERTEKFEIVTKKINKTKTCYSCNNDFHVLFRVQLQKGKTWVFVCESCCKSAQSLPNYKYGGTWKG